MLSLQTLHQAVPSSLPILNSSASILHSTKELLCLPEGNIFSQLLKSPGVCYKHRLKLRCLFQVPPMQRLQDVITFGGVLMQRGPDLSALAGKAFPVQALQNPGITWKIDGSVKAQVMCPGGRFPYQDKRRQVGPLHAPYPARCACRAHGRCPHSAAPALPCSAPAAPEQSRSRNGQTSLSQPDPLSKKNTCISEDESAACHLNVLCVSPCPAVKPSSGVMSTQHRRPQLLQLRHPLVDAQPGHQPQPWLSTSNGCQTC